MDAIGPITAALCALRTGRSLIAGAVLLAAPTAALPAMADGTSLNASYVIAIGGFTIGRADVKGTFSDREYSAAISGSTFGISRFVSDARASLAGAGRINGTTINPANYNLDTAESDLSTQVRMSLRGGSVVSLAAAPSLIEAADRVPLTARHKNNILDPVGAFLVAVDNPGDGDRVCNRTVKVFDGWQRFDIRLTYQETKAVSGAYSGNAMVCGARYVPIAGHRPSRESVEYMANNRRLEVWMVPVAGTKIMIPYRILIGTQVGDLVVQARTFQTRQEGEQAASN